MKINLPVDKLFGCSATPCGEDGHPGGVQLRHNTVSVEGMVEAVKFCYGNEPNIRESWLDNIINIEKTRDDGWRQVHSSSLTRAPCSIGCLAVIAGETQAGVPKVQGGKRGDPIPGCMLQFVNCGGPSRPFSAWRVAKTVSVYLDKSFGRFDLLPVTVPDLWPVTVPGGGGRLTGVTGVPRGT